MYTCVYVKKQYRQVWQCEIQTIYSIIKVLLKIKVCDSTLVYSTVHQNKWLQPQKVLYSRSVCLLLDNGDVAVCLYVVFYYTTKHAVLLFRKLYIFQLHVDAYITCTCTFNFTIYNIINVCEIVGGKNYQLVKYI